MSAVRRENILSTLGSDERQTNDLQRDPQQHSALFGYQTGISLRGAERRFLRLRLLLLVVLISAIAGLLFAAIILLAIADSAAVPTGLLDLVISPTNRN
jgi:hypothetical protein